MYILIHEAFLQNFILKNIFPKSAIKNRKWYKEIIHFWFEEIESKSWFIKDELWYKKVIETFSIYPQLNKILNRKSTKAELDFLKGPNSSF